MLPKLLSGDRKRLFGRLLLIGLAQAGLALLSSALLASLLSVPFGVASVPWAGFLLLAAAAAVHLRSVELSVAEHFGQDYVTEVRLELFRATMSAQHARQRHGIAMARMITDLTSLKNWVSLGVARIIVASFSICGALAALYLWSPAFTFWALPVLVTVLVVGGTLAIPLRRHIRMSRRHRGRLAARYGELSLARETLLQFGVVNRESGRIRRISRHMSDGLTSRMRYVGLLQALPDMVVPAGAVAFAAASVLDAAATKENPLIALIILGFIVQPLRDILSSIDYAIAFAEGRRRIAPVIGHPKSKSAKDGLGPPAEQPVPFGLHIAIGEAIGASKDQADRKGSETMPAATVLPDSQTRVEIAPVGMTAISSSAPEDVGDLFRWLSGVSSQPSKICTVSFGGRDVATMSQRQRRSAFQLLSPSLPLLRRNLQRNLSDMTKGLQADEIRDILQLCGIEEDWEAKRCGRRKLEERGRGLSASFAARVRLARAALAKPEILLVDDETFLHDSAARAALTKTVARYGIGAFVILPRSAKPMADWQQVDLPLNVHDQETSAAAQK